MPPTPPPRPTRRNPPGDPTCDVAEITAQDGTTIGYRRLGAGPGLVMLPGAGQSGENLLPLARTLAGAFSVYLPDRRGRGLSGPCGDGHGLATEVEDLGAVLDATGARYAFGHSAGAVIALMTALHRPDLAKVALYEPPLITATTRHGEWVPRYEEEMRAGHLGGALVAVLHGTADRGSVWRFVPPSLLAAPLNVLLALADKKGGPGSSPGSLIASVHFDARVVTEAGGPVERFAGLACDLLLLGGSRSAPNLVASLDELAAVVPGARRVTLRGAGHTAPMARRWVGTLGAHLGAFFAG